MDRSAHDFGVNSHSSMQPGRPRYLLFLGIWIIWSASLGSSAQDAKKPAATQPDHSAEAFVIEESVDRWGFENDGSGSREKTARVRLQSDAGVQEFGLLTFAYQKAVESVEIDYVRVRKPDGSVVPTPLDELQDMPAAVTREAPFYSDLREKHLAVKGLSIGDVLEFHWHTNITKPLVPGQFWMQHAFSRQIILEEKLQVSVPRDRAVNFKSPGLKPVITEEGQHRIYSWIRSNPEVQRRSKAELGDLAIHGEFPAPDVQLSSFQSWEEVGRWYHGLEQDRIIPSAEIRAKAAELTRNAADDAAKIQAIYKYVSTEYRYIGVAFGIGRYQPHAANEVLSNQYGDCKDKHTLLASLLSAAGIPAYAALINSSHIIDPDVPSPGQFDHVITAVPRDKDLLWLDTTTEVGPLGYLSLALRAKQALMVFGDRPATFQQTPADPPLPTSWTYKINAKLDESGNLEGKVEQTMRGDLEVISRATLRSLPRTEWKGAIQRFSYGIGFSGEVSDVTASMPEATETPFHIAYAYRKKNYGDWENHRIVSAVPIPFVPPLEEDGKLPQRFWLSAPGEREFECRIELPKGYAPDLPPNKDLSEDFAEYHSTYAFQDNTFVARFRILVKSGEISGKRVDDYKAMAEKALKDQHQFILLSSAQAQSPIESQKTLILRIWELPDSTDAGAREAGEEGRAAMRRGSLKDGLPALQRAVARDPKYTRAWLLMGEVYLFTGRADAAINAVRQAVDVDPQQALPYKVLAFDLASLGRRSEAIKAWQDLEKVAPDDREIPASLGGLLVADKRFSDAVPYLEKAVQQYPENAASQAALATAYLNSGQDEKAAGLFDKLLQLHPDAETQNNIAYMLANANKRPDDALRYAREAVRAEEEASSKVQLSHLVADDLRHTLSLGAYWDTLGWVYYRQGNLKEAEGYLFAAWTLRQDPIIGYHLAQVYEKQLRKTEAARMYRLVTGVIPSGRSGEDLDAIAQAKKQQEHKSTEAPRRPGRVLEFDDPAGDLSRDRSITLPTLAVKGASAEFFLLFAPESKTAAGASVSMREAVVEDTKFVSGSDLLRSAGQALSQARFKVAFPDGSSGRLVRRGILSCHSGCTFVLLLPGDVRSVD